MLHQGSVKEVTKGQASIEVGASDMTRLKSELEKLAGIKGINKELEFYRVMVEDEVTVEYISGALLKNGITPTHLRKTESSLEEQFMKILDRE